MPPQQRQRVITYIDGFNLYFGLRDSRMRRFYWLNLQALGATLLKRNQDLVRTKYFTARISGPTLGNRSSWARRLEAKRKRQNRYLEAVGTIGETDMYYGHYLAKRMKCKTCGVVWQMQEEKMTDVNIATELLADAYEDRYDVAILISADSDLVAPVQAVRRLFPQRRVIIALPPARHSKNLVNAASGYVFIEAHALAKSQFPDRVVKADGFILERPADWR